MNETGTEELRLPPWHPPSPKKEKVAMTEEGYLAWLAEERKLLVAQGLLEKLREDPARCPVDAPFVL